MSRKARVDTREPFCPAAVGSRITQGRLVHKSGWTLDAREHHTMQSGTVVGLPGWQCHVGALRSISYDCCNHRIQPPCRFAPSAAGQIWFISLPARASDSGDRHMGYALDHNQTCISQQCVALLQAELRGDGVINGGSLPGLHYCGACMDSTSGCAPARRSTPGTAAARLSCTTWTPP